MNINVVVSVLLLAFLASEAHPSDSSRVESKFDWTLSPIAIQSGVEPTSLPSHRGETMLLFYFSPECGHCQETWPQIVEIATRARARGFMVGAIATYATSRQDISDFGQALGWDFPIWFDSTRTVANRYGIKTIPKAILVRSNGQMWMMGQLDSEKMQILETNARHNAWVR